MSDSSTTRESMAVARLQAVGPSRWDVASMRWQSEALQRLTVCLIAGVTGGLGAYVEAAKRAGVTPLQPLGELQPEERYSLMQTVTLLSAPISDTATLKNRGREEMDMRPLFSRLAEWALSTYSCDALATRLQYQDLKNLTDAWDTTARNSRQFRFASYVVTSMITACQSAAREYDDTGNPADCLPYLEDDAQRKLWARQEHTRWHQLADSSDEYIPVKERQRRASLEKAARKLEARKQAMRRG